MSLPTTETQSEGEAIDALPAIGAAQAILDGQQAAVDAVRHAVPEIAQAAKAVSAAIRQGGTIHYAAAGSSGLMALADACELPGTFGIPAASVRIHMAGGVPIDGYMPGGTEDDTEVGQAVEDLISEKDAVVVLTASGTTPYALDIATRARRKGAKVIGIANNPGTPLLEDADVAICLETPPEALAGSTRLGAGTAQKAALNVMSTLMGVELGHVYRGMMVNLVADNAKLIARSARVVSTIAEVPLEEAKNALALTRGHTKSAILVAAGCDLNGAEKLLARYEGHLGPCLKSLTSNQDLVV